MYWIYSNRTHVLLLQHDLPDVDADMPSQELLCDVMAQAAAGFDAAGLSSAKLTMMTYFNQDELDAADEPGDLFLPPDAVLAAARLGSYGEPEAVIDDTAVVSGWNVQAWQSVSPDAVVRWMLHNGPVLRRRSTPDREQALAHQHQAGLDAIARLLHRVLDPGEGLESFVVVYREGDAVLSFACQAEDPDHAIDQALNAYPDAEILATVPLPPSARDALMLALAAAGDELAASLATQEALAAAT